MKFKLSGQNSPYKANNDILLSLFQSSSAAQFQGVLFEKMAVFTKKGNIKYFMISLTMCCGLYTMKDFLQLSNTNINGMRQEVKLGSSQNKGKHFMFSILLP